MPKKNQDKEIEQMKEDIRDIRNDINEIKGNTHNMSRILTIGSRETIKQDLIALLSNSPKRLQILLLTKEYISREELATKINTDIRNLNTFLDPLYEKGYLSDKKDGRKKLYRRTDLINQVGFEKIPEIAKAFKQFEDNAGNTGDL
jgi:DNA-binding transcriptional ArsR family regulator